MRCCFCHLVLFSISSAVFVGSCSSPDISRSLANREELGVSHIPTFEVVFSRGDHPGSPLSTSTASLPRYVEMQEGESQSCGVLLRGEWNSDTKLFRPWRGFRVHHSDVPWLNGPFDQGYADVLGPGQFVLGDEIEPILAEVEFLGCDGNTRVQRGIYSSADRVLYLPSVSSARDKVSPSLEFTGDQENGQITKISGYVVISK